MEITKERRKEEIQKLTSAILDAALGLAVKEDWDAVTIRKIAEKIRYSPPIIYRYFKNKEDIFAELYLRSLKIFQTYLFKDRKEESNPRKVLVKGAKRYWKFAFENPQLYELLFVLKTPTFRKEGDGEEGRKMFLTGLAMIEAINPGLSHDEKHDFLANYFSLIHGYVHLALAGKLYTEEGGVPEAKKSMIRAVKRLTKTI